MFPLGDASRRLGTIPVITIALVAANAVVFYFELTQGEPFILRWAVVPSVIARHEHYETIVSAMFMHGGWMHIIGNMIFLWSFGPQIEAVMGPIRYLLFYFLGGIAAFAAQIAADPTSTIPNLGASGAIAAVMGAFLVIFPRDQIRTLIFAGVFTRIVYLPAILLIGLWFLLQVLSVNMEQAQGEAAGGVAYLAHIGGAIFGAAAAKIFERRGG
ncbi:MAG: rhomboid family intramembrane serine protease [Alphaproteobacteria bacterium]|nr:rhomboid family intramembrane serine protease [Alphaproteobacteria bacterium]